jgi:hypothetical protein
LGQKIHLIETDEREVFIGGQGCFGTSSLSENEKVWNLSETNFEVSLDGDFSRDCEFVVSLPTMDGNSSDSSDGSDFRPRRGDGNSKGASEKGERRPESKPDATVRGGRNSLNRWDSESSPESEGEDLTPYRQRKVACEWERIALRAEESLKRYQQGLVERKGEAKLKDTLSFLLNEDSGVMDERNTKSEWSARAFDQCQVTKGWC